MEMFDKRSLVDQVYEKLRNDILSMKYPFGSKINVNELQKKIGVSCTPIREAINRLQQEGLIIYKNNAGAQILTLDGKDVENIQELSMTLHQAAIKFSMQRGDKATILEDLRRYDEEFIKAKTPDAEVTAIYQFIGVFYHNCKNERLDHTMISIQGLQLLIRHLYAKSGIQKEADVADLANIISAFEAGDCVKVCSVLQQNADRATAQVIAFIGQK